MATVAVPSTAAPASRWIIGRGADVCWLMGGTAVGLALVAAHALFGLDLLVAWLPWLVLLNGPHLFATWSRTYFDREEWRRRAPLLVGSLGFFLLGPAMLAACAALASAGVSWHRAPLVAYLTLTVLWAFWHTVRQHWGVLRLYGRKAGDSKSDRACDAALVHVGLIAPFVVFLASHPEARPILRLPETPGPWETAARVVILAAFAAVAAAALVRFARRGASTPKLVFLAVVVPYYAFVCLSGLLLDAPLLGIVPVLIVPHDIQYLALVRHYHRGRASPPRLVPFAAGALALGLLLGLLSCAFDAGLGCLAATASASPVLFGGSGVGVRDLLLVTFQGFFIHHYFVDQFIWKPGRDRVVAERLGV